MEKFKYLEHTADAKFQAFGHTMEEAFANSALAMFNLLIEPEKIKPKIELQIELAANKLESLLYDWLNELLFHLDVDGFLLHSVKQLKIEDNKLSAIVIGDNGDYETKGNIKSMTYTDMFIKKENTLFIIQVVVDI